MSCDREALAEGLQRFAFIRMEVWSIMRIAIVDDVEKDAYILEEKLRTSLEALHISIELLDIYSGGVVFVQEYEEKAYDLVFLDIYIGDMTGIDIASKIREKDLEIKIVFCSTSNEFASESYALRVDYYLRKPLCDEYFEIMFDHLGLGSIQKGHYVVLPDGQKLLVHNFVFAEYHNHCITIHTKYGADIQTRLSQKELESQLAVYEQFVCCSKGLLVNLHEIEQIENSMILTKGGDTIPVSRRRLKETQEIYEEYLFQQLRKTVIEKELETSS